MMEKTITLLAIETSCDETGLAVVQKDHGEIKVLSQVVASQVDIHAETGGVVPEVAAREHTKVLRPLLKKVLREANLSPSSEGELEGVDAIAVTVGPGLIPALAVGVQAARTLAYAWHKPIIPVHHIEGHLYSALLQPLQPTTYSLPPNSFPALALIVSGGHTMLIEMRDHLQYKVLGETRDDAAGEAFDKVARLLNLPYPGGPAISQLAERGNPEAFNFPRPMIHSRDLDFSFSGLKTAVYYALRNSSLDKGRPGGISSEDVAASFQQAVVDTLVAKTLQAFEKIQPRVVLLAGGVAANTLLRRQLQTAIKSHGGRLRVAPLSLCGDNAVMIGLAGMFAYENKRTVHWKEVDASARMSIERDANLRIAHE